jgi:ABC-type lipoprotein export system ATPase subunit
MKNIADIASAGEQAIITGRYGLGKSKLTEIPEKINEGSDGETEIILKDGTRVTVYDAVEPLVELPGTWEAEEEEA